MSKDVLDTLIAEAGSDPEGLRAVAWVIQNRATQWGMTPEQVVRQKGQFEGYYKPGPKSVEAQKSAKVRAKAEAAWNDVVSGKAPDPTNGGTSFRAKGTKQPAPNGTVEIAGNVFALGSARPNSALAAINAAAPMPMAARPSLLAFAPRQEMAEQFNLAPPALPLNPSMPPRASSWQEAGGPPMRGDIPLPRPRPTPPAPSRGVGTAYLAPATPVRTLRIDPLTNQVISSPSGNSRQASAQQAAEQRQYAARPTVQRPPVPARVTGADPGAGRASTFQTANRTLVQGVPFVGPIVNGVVSAVDLVSNRPSAAAQAKPQPQPTTLPSVIPPAPKGYNTLTGKYETMQPSTPYVAGPAPVRTAPKTYTARAPVRDPLLDAQDEKAFLRSRQKVSVPTVPVPRMPMAKPLALSMPVQPVRRVVTPPPMPRPRPVLLAAPQPVRQTGGLLGLLFGGGSPSPAPVAQPVQQKYTTPLPGQAPNTIAGVDIAFMPKAVQQSDRWREVAGL